MEHKYRFAIFSPVKDEIRLKEWILYYTKLGVDLFIIGDDYSKIPVKTYFEELKIDKNNYEIFTHEKENINYEKLDRNYKGSYYRTDAVQEKIVPLCKKHNIDYLMIFDSDEFLYLNKFNNLQEMVKYYQPFDAINVNWLLFHTNIKENKSDSLIKTFVKSNNNLLLFSKQIVKISLVKTGSDAHKIIFNKKPISKNIFNIKIKYNLSPTSRISNRDYTIAPLYLAHYVFKDIKTFVENKLIRYDQNFKYIYGKKINYEQKKQIINFNIKNKNLIIDYIYDLINNNRNNINNINNIIPEINKYKDNYLKYYTLYKNSNIYNENNDILNYMYN